MKVGVPKEIKNHEYRVGMQPAGIRALVKAGHEVVVQRSAGQGSGFEDDDFVGAGARLVDTAAEAWDAEMVVKVKEPLAEEYDFFKAGQILYTYLHLAAVPQLTRALMDKKVRGVAYETITDAHGGLPLLRPMSEIAGRMAPQVGAWSLEKANGGRGMLLGGVPGTRRGRVTVIGGGIVGTAAARIAIGLGAKVTVLDINAARMSYLEDVFGTKIETLYSNAENIEKYVLSADMVIGAVLVPGAAAPKLVTETLVQGMKAGSVVVDVAVDQGGCIETCRPTTHQEPTYIAHDVVHYCVANMPGAVPRTSTYALTNATLPYCLELANKGADAAIRESLAGNGHLAEGVNTWDGACTIDAVARACEVDFTSLANALG
ncbi:alanine dehydrogenase [Plesiocystis pacifica SIR-1]|uniref:Alanine dehydrogenase n=1 Tax=Plesiocystis pacifica SIR-1 TaxID=391625 RepID=A6G7J1_9BACT|nr:alanine dehydrogenase [Plesiocystis pacifica]EDM78200.1 alanine dehydrogenase [Plesiocystis pacifica SIR-1]